MASDKVVVDKTQETQVVESSAIIAAESEAVSVRETSAATEKEGDPPPPQIEVLKPGMRLKGTVRNIVNFGAFIDVGVGRDGLAHISALQRAGINRTIRVGDVLDVQIRRVDVESNRISLTIPGAGKRTRKPLRDLKVDSVVDGRVVRLVDFGAFVDIGSQADGLLHISELPRRYVGHPSEVVQVGEEVRVRILDVDERKRRISLTMKATESVQEEEAPENASAGPSVPTAFQVAWERALAERRGRQRKASG
jgi:small subunit ribosomal protein S1